MVYVDFKIINIFQRNFFIYEIEIFKWGFKFILIFKKNDVDVIKDIEEFCRKFRFREFF